MVVHTMSVCQKCMLKLSGRARGGLLYTGFKPAEVLSQRYATLPPSNAQSELPVIRVPKAMQQKVSALQRKRKPAPWRGRVFTARPGTEVISSKRKEFNHYLNQTYDKFAPPKLASQGWKHSRSRGDYFTVVAYTGNPSIIPRGDNDGDGTGVKGKSFEDLKLDVSLIDGLTSLDIDTPTSIQSCAIPVIKQGKNTLCAAETGSGKTLAYLLPLMQRLLEESRMTGVTMETSLPRSIVLVPVGELAVQVWEVARILAESAGLKVQYLDGEKSLKFLKNKLSSQVDIVISTPGPVLNAVRQEFTSLDAVCHVVIDESDTMLDDSFIQQTLKLLTMVKIGSGKPCKVTAPGEAQLTLVGATMPRKASNILAEIIPPENLDIISTPHLHRIMPHVHQKFLRLHTEDKAIRILELLKKEHKRHISTMVFCNTTPTCDWLFLFLKENGVDALRLHSKMGSKSRSGVMSAFKSGKASTLVCTDIASRGVDTIQVQHVINFDFPNFMSDYIHRTGRVGRVGSQGSGRVTNFVVHKWDVELVNKIERAVRKREDLPSVDANIKGKHTIRMIDEELQDIDRSLQG